MAERKFTDNNGVSKVILEGNDAPLGGDFVNNKYVIANHISKNNFKKMKAPGFTRENIGIGSSGFAGVIIAFVTLSY